MRQRNEPGSLPQPPTPVTPPQAEPADARTPAPPSAPAPLPEAFPPPPPPMVDNTPPPPQPITEKWWFWTAIGVGVLAVAGGTLAYYATGTTTMVPPGGTIGTLDRR